MRYMREGMIVNVTNLIKIGGKLWEKAGMSRVYFEVTPDMVGLTVDRYKSGSVSSATLDGNDLSNTKAADLLGALGTTKAFVDVASGVLVVQAPQSARVMSRFEIAKRVTAAITVRIGDDVVAA